MLALLMQGPATLVQEAAWVNMLVSYTQERGFARGVVETFDGEHPCELCKAAEKLRNQSGNEPDEPVAPSAQRPNLAWGPMTMPPSRAVAPQPNSLDLPSPRTAWKDSMAGRGGESPETPPPEAV